MLDACAADSCGPRLEEAETIVALGMGAITPTCRQAAAEAARLLGGQLAATRLAVEAGFLSHDQQVGQTGRTVKPNLYFACGVSGAVQHTAGMGGSKCIVAINRDAGAPIMDLAHYAVIGDAEKILEALAEELKGRLA